MTKIESQKELDSQDNGQIIPPIKENGDQYTYAAIIAEISQYTDRPDLFLEVIEKHDPGFIASINKDAAEFSRKNRDARFNFGKNQAYVSLGIQCIAAVFILCIAAYLAYLGKFEFWPILSLSLLYAVTQGGSKGFLKIIEGLHNLLSTKKPETSLPDHKRQRKTTR